LLNLKKRNIFCLNKKKELLLCPDFSLEGRKVVLKRYPPSGFNLLIIKQMYAIVEMNGQQFKVEKEEKMFVHHIQNAENGQTIEFEKVLLVEVDGAITVGTPSVSGAKVVCEIISPLVKGDKVLIFHKKRRKGHRKLNGHRQQFTEVVIKDIVV
jgi:large subunit ribosomal protein L21